MNIKSSIAQALGYIASRQCQNGGFCHYQIQQVQEANLHDTYYAVMSYRLLNQRIPQWNKLLDYVLSQGLPGRQADYLYYHGFIVGRLGVATLDHRFLDNVSALAVRPPSKTKSIYLSDWLANCLKVVLLKKAFLEDAELENVKQRVHDLLHKGGAGVKPNLVDTYLALSILAELDGLDELDKTKAFVERLQCKNFGFRATEDSYFSHTEIMHAGVFSCALLGIELRYPEKVLNFVLMSQKQNGGFARSHDSLGDLRTNYHVLKTIQQLSGELDPKLLTVV